MFEDFLVNYDFQPINRICPGLDLRCRQFWDNRFMKADLIAVSDSDRAGIVRFRERSTKCNSKNSETIAHNS